MEIMGNLRKALVQFGNEKVECLAKSETILEEALLVRQELGKLARKE